MLRNWGAGQAFKVGLYVVGACAFVLGAGIDIYYWATQAQSTEAAFAYGGGSVLFQVAVLLFAGITGYLLFQGVWWQKLLAVPAGIVLVFFLSYNMLGVMSFQARERVVPVQQAQEMRQAQIDKQLEAENLQNQRQNEAIKTLRDDALAATTAIRRAPTKQARAAAVEMKRAADSAYATAAFATVTTMAPVELPKVIDPQAEFIAMFLPFTVAQIQLVMTAWWGIGLQALKVLCWFFAPAMTLRRRGSIIDSTPQRLREEAPPKQKPVMVVNNEPPAAARTYAYGPFPDVKGKAEQAATPVDRVAMWREDATCPMPGAKVSATPMHQHFQQWCALKGYPGLNVKLFGSCCSKLGFVRDLGNGRGNFYLDVWLCPLGEEGPIKIAA